MYGRLFEDVSAVLSLQESAILALQPKEKRG